MINKGFEPVIDLDWTVDNQNRTNGGHVGRHLLLGFDLGGQPLTYYGEIEHAPG